MYIAGTPYFNPGFNVLTRFGALDLFENYRITGGFRFAGNFDSNEYLLSVENLKGTFDKQLIFHRQAILNYNDSSLFKTYSHNIYLSYAKPITPVLAVKGTLSYRYDRHNIMATDNYTLDYKGFSQHWAGLKGEIIYDNTRKRSVNIYFGTRFKIFGEYYREIKSAKSDMYVLGIDYRKYIRIHRGADMGKQVCCQYLLWPHKTDILSWWC